ncbi:MAG: radical SAM protein [Candidatus Bathyarchaeota archaeon]|nr:radical SAM protein [Candidatus Termiticorpusculum sp.]
MDRIKYLRVSATTKCNASCWYCFNESQPFDYSTLEDIDGFGWLVNQLVSEYGTEIIRFTGGEPLMNPHIEELIKLAKKTGVKKVGLTTNGLLLREKADALLACEIDDYAIHLNRVDFEQMNYRRETAFMEWAVKKFPSVKFNIVVMTQNKTNVASIVNYAIDHGINLLLLDLLQAGNTVVAYEKSFCSLEDIRNQLLNRGLIETIENMNSKVYSNDRSSIKLLQHYSDMNIRVAYCTKFLTFHPILLTPDMKLSICTHFGKRAISIETAVKTRSTTLLYKIIEKLKYSLEHCVDCARFTTLKELQQ